MTALESLEIRVYRIRIKNTNVILAFPHPWKTEVLGSNESSNQNQTETQNILQI